MNKSSTIIMRPSEIRDLPYDGFACVGLREAHPGINMGRPETESPGQALFEPENETQSNTPPPVILMSKWLDEE